MHEFQGIGASQGVVIGPALVWHRPYLVVGLRQCRPEQIAGELLRLQEAIATTRDELQRLRAHLASRLGEEQGSILDAQLLILEDETMLAATRQAIEVDRLTAEAAFTRAMTQALIPLDLHADAVLRERIVDFRDLEQRVLRALLGGAELTPTLTEPSVLVAPLLTPSETVALDRHQLLGFCIDEGGPTSHTAILARSLGVPAVVGLRDMSGAVRSGQTLVVDGSAGTVVVDAPPAVVRRYEARIKRQRQLEVRLRALRDAPAVTPDGHPLELSANVEVPVEIDLALEQGAHGIGLLRTEYFYFMRGSFSNEDEQVGAYRDVLARARGQNVTFRVLDVGGDKFITAEGGSRENNPQLGMRGIRFLLANAEILRTQLRALLRASTAGPLRIMYPMITGVEELRAANAMYHRCRRELQHEGVEMAAHVEVGVMIETPSAVSMARELASECQFFSIGTNDLTQYMLAVDRTNSRVAHLHRPHHPAVLRAIGDVIVAAHERGIHVELCGEMGANPGNAVLLMGLGIDGISTHAAAIPVLKNVIRTVTYAQAKQWAAEALRMSTADEVRAMVRSKTLSSLRDVLERRA